MRVSASSQKESEESSPSAGPCADCPFRSDRPFFLSPERVDEIADASHADLGFSCHGTNDFDQDDGQATVIEFGGVMARPEWVESLSQTGDGNCRKFCDS